MDSTPVNVMGIAAAWSAKKEPIDIARYFPLDPDLRWGLMYTAQRRNGEILTSDMHWKLHGQTEVNGKKAWLLGDKDTQTFMISLDEDGIQHHGMISPNSDDEVSCPALTTISNSFGFGQAMSAPYLMRKGDKKTLGYFVHQMSGYETIKLPAGIFKDCLRTDTYYQREGGTCFYSAIHYAPEVGMVRYSFRQIDPARNAVIIYGVKELTYFKRDGI